MVGNMRDMKPLIMQSEMTFQLKGRLPTVKSTSDFKYITPRLERIAPAAKTAIILAGSKYFIRNVQIQRQPINRQSAMR